MKKIIVLFALFGSVGLSAFSLIAPDWILVRDMATGQVDLIDDGDERCTTWIDVYADGSFDTCFIGGC